MAGRDVLDLVAAVAIVVGRSRSCLRFHPAGRRNCSRHVSVLLLAAVFCSCSSLFKDNGGKFAGATGSPTLTVTDICCVSPSASVTVTSKSMVSRAGRSCLGPRKPMLVILTPLVSVSVEKACNSPAVNEPSPFVSLAPATPRAPSRLTPVPLVPSSSVTRCPRPDDHPFLARCVVTRWNSMTSRASWFRERVNHALVGEVGCGAACCRTGRWDQL